MAILKTGTSFGIVLQGGEINELLAVLIHLLVGVEPSNILQLEYISCFDSCVHTRVLLFYIAHSVALVLFSNSISE